MLRENIANSESAPTWEHGNDWQTIDRALRTIAKRRAALDCEEARWLREAERVQIWRQLGMVSAIDYMDRVLGYGPHAAQERLRVARALAQLPATAEALERGALSFSAVRELSRVVTPWTEEDWLVEAEGKNVRQIEELVAGHSPGDWPDDPVDPKVRRHRVTFEMTAETLAALREARRVLDEEHGQRLDDNELIAALAATVLDGAGSGAEPTGRARHQIAVTVCERCRQGWQDGAGVVVPISQAAVECAECDAEHIGSLDADTPARAHQDIPPAVRRFVLRRDHGRCRVPGCRSARGLEVHHIKHREHGGGHEPSNLVAICFACHQAHHEGRLAIWHRRRPRGRTADDLEVRRASSPTADGPSERTSHAGPDPVAADALQALVTLGWKPAIARTAVRDAVAEVGPASFDTTFRAALRHCPR